MSSFSIVGVLSGWTLVCLKEWHHRQFLALGFQRTAETPRGKSQQRDQLVTFVSLRRIPVSSNLRQERVISAHGFSLL